MSTQDSITELWKELESSITQLSPYEYLDLKIKLQLLRGIEEELDAIRLCLIDRNKKI